MAVNGVSNMLNSKIRMSGLTSGLDVDGLVKSMLANDKAKLDKLGQKRQLNEWRQDAYREVTSALKTFKDDNFDVLKPTANMKSMTGLAALTTEYKQLTADTVSVVSSADGNLGEHTIKVTQLATQAQVLTGSLTEDLAGSISLSAFPLDLTGKTLSTTIDGTTKVLALGNYETLDALKMGLQTGIDTAFGNGRATVSLAGSDNKSLKFATSAGSEISISGDAAVLKSLSFDDRDSISNRLATGNTLTSVAGFFRTPLGISDPKANISFQINGKTIDVGKTYEEASLSDVISAVNKSDAGVEMKYNSLSDTISLKNKGFGSANSLTWTDTKDGLLTSMGITAGTKTAAKDAVFDLDGVTGMVRNSNSFTVEGNSYTLKQLGEVKVNITKNTDEMVTRIKNFVTKYNELLDKVNGKYSEKYDKNYQPLTDSEKESMDASTITKWETKAKTGLLSKDNNLSDITSAMRTAMFQKVDGIDISLSDIGISSASYLDKGKLRIDEIKLKESLNNNYSEVVSLFTKESKTPYADTITDATNTKRIARDSDSGLAQRLYDVLQDNIRTTSGKGTLLTKAGMIGDVTEYVNLIDDDINKTDKAITSMATKITAKETKLYARFAALETALNKMNSQSSWLSSQSSSN